MNLLCIGDDNLHGLHRCSSEEDKCGNRHLDCGDVSRRQTFAQLGGFCFVDSVWCLRRAVSPQLCKDNQGQQIVANWRSFASYRFAQECSSIRYAYNLRLVKSGLPMIGNVFLIFLYVGGTTMAIAVHGVKQSVADEMVMGSGWKDPRMLCWAAVTS